MEFFQLFQYLFLPLAVVILFVTLLELLFICWLRPTLLHQKLRRNGFGGPTPTFPLGNLGEIKKKRNDSVSEFFNITHDIHSTVFPYFDRWRKSHGKVFIYWLGSEPFLYVADPEFLKQMSSGVMDKRWGKPNVFKHDRRPLFGDGLLMAEGDIWVHHRHVITPAFSPANLKAMATVMVESATKMLDQWTYKLITSGDPEIDVEEDIISTAAQIIAKTIFGIEGADGSEVFDKLRAMQVTLFKYHRFVGVPFGKFMNLKQTLEAKKLGKEIDRLLLKIITSRKISAGNFPQRDLLEFLLAESRGGQVGRKLTTWELVDECKTFFFGGHETTALAVTWTLLLLATNPDWQVHLREEIMQVIGDGPIDPTMLARLKKMNWVMNEVLRLYSPAPNVQRQAREDIRVGKVIIPKGTNIWIDVVGMHHDQALWGEDVNEFKPERFKEDPHGGCKHKMGYLPFGFGGRMCVGRSLMFMEYKIVLTLILSRFSFSLSPNYCHSPSIMLTLRPTYGLPIIFQPL